MRDDIIELLKAFGAMFAVIIPIMLVGGMIAVMADRHQCYAVWSKEFAPEYVGAACTIKVNGQRIPDKAYRVTR